MRRGRGAMWAVAAMLAGCGGGASAEGPDETPSEPAAVVEHPVPEGEVGIVRLSPAAVEHLGIETAEVVSATAPRVRTVAGFVTVPPGRSLAVTAAVSGTLRGTDTPLRPGTAVSRGDVLLRLTPMAPVDRDLRAQARRQRAATRARVDLAQARVDRLTKLLTDRASSQRAIEEATAELDTAQAEDEAARARQRAIERAPLAADVTLPVLAPEDGLVRTVSVAPGQTVAAGAPLFDVVPADGLWVRVPVVPGELDRIDPKAEISVTRLGGEPGDTTAATPVDAPPSADPVAATVDLFYALSSDAPLRRPGERVMATLRYAETAPTLEVPGAAVLLGVDGGAWVYVCEDETSFRRVRVDVEARQGDRARLRRGPPEGTCVVGVGAIELMGAEFGVKH